MPHDADFRSPDEEFADEALAEIERRHDLERQGRLAAEVEVELAENGPLARYVAARRGDAMVAIALFRKADPRDAVAMTRIQAEIEGYLQVRDWIVGTMRAADEAAQIIQEEYGSRNDNDRYRD